MVVGVEGTLLRLESEVPLSLGDDGGALWAAWWGPLVFLSSAKRFSTSFLNILYSTMGCECIYTEWSHTRLYLHRFD
jgi:hypothetical protein